MKERPLGACKCLIVIKIVAQHHKSYVALSLNISSTDNALRHSFQIGKSDFRAVVNIFARQEAMIPFSQTHQRR